MMKNILISLAASLGFLAFSYGVGLLAVSVDVLYVPKEILVDVVRLVYGVTITVISIIFITSTILVDD